MVVLVVARTRFNIEGDWEGLYLLKGTEGKLFELKDDIFLGEYERLLFKFNFESLQAQLPEKKSKRGPYFEYKWQKRRGHGYIHSFFPDGSRFIACFSRFRDSQDKVPKGLFVGGGLPSSKYENKDIRNEETGVAWFDGTRWYHLWCNANEAIASASEKQVFPSQWEFLGSRVIYDHKGELILESNHRVTLDGHPFQVNRFVMYTAGDRHFFLIIEIKNIGQVPAGYYYLYGDEPWVGDFGTSAGNVGWLKDRPFYFEGYIDTTANSFAGMYDIGNPYVLGGTSAQYTEVANFIDWSYGVKPDMAYFSNTIGTFADEKKKVPLFSKQNRVIMLQWGPRILAPGKSDRLVLAIGMAYKDPRKWLPVKPETKLDMNMVDFLLQEEGK
ncbi:MAG: hypothetical protein HYS23_14670 [Geobacter sp.]|nr:hypothetical protein [Geobacter sp.]